MPKPLSEVLSSEKALIFRVTHRSNLTWILRNGLHCERSETRDPNFVTIGNADLIARRRDRHVPISPGGTLADYVPFYFTPFSPMLYNIRTGWGGIQKRANDEIVVLVSSLRSLEENGVDYIFTDRHAYLSAARFGSTRARVHEFVDYPLLQRRDFSADPDNPGKIERYQAEALGHRFVPVEAIDGVCCYTRSIQKDLMDVCSEIDVNVRVVVRPDWYFQ